MRIGILTGGGDVPSLNTVIHDVTYRAARENSASVIGLRRGWGSLIYMDPDNIEMDPDHAFYLNEEKVRGFDREGGTLLRTSRIQPSEVKYHPALQKYRNIDFFEGKRDMTQDVLKNLENLRIDILFAIGGDDTLKYARHLSKLGFPVIGIPKTMDGDVAGTDYCLGFNTAIERSNQYVTNLRSHLGSHERIGVIEVFGRHSGHTGLYTALAAKPDRLVIPEVDFDIHRLAELLVYDKKRNSSNYSMVIASEGAKQLGETVVKENDKIDSYGHVKLGGIGKRIAGQLEELTGEDVMEENLRYLLRSGPPSPKDKTVASMFANIAVDSAIKHVAGKLTAIRDGKVCLVELEETKKSPTEVDVSRQYNSERYRPNYKGLVGVTVML